MQQVSKQNKDLFDASINEKRDRQQLKEQQLQAHERFLNHQRNKKQQVYEGKMKQGLDHTEKERIQQQNIINYKREQELEKEKIRIAMAQGKSQI